jgi:hypothetical protein
LVSPLSLFRVSPEFAISFRHDPRGNRALLLSSSYQSSFLGCWFVSSHFIFS